MIVDFGRYIPSETGGILLGYWVTPDEVVITDATSAGLRARHRADGYEPDVGHDQREIARIYAESGRQHTYLGDWHTHPGSEPALSRRDRKTLRAIAADVGARALAPLMMIIGSGEDAVTATVWYLPAGARKARGLRLKLFD
jgi:integrative and conjugative element protein (TIGR02256 family)